MANTYWLKFGSGHPTLTTGLAPTFVVFNTGLTALTAPGITQPIAGYGLYQFTYTPSYPITFVCDGATTNGSILSSSERYITGSLDVMDNLSDLRTTLASEGSTVLAIGGTLTAIGAAQANMGSTLVSYGSSLVTIASNVINNGTTLVANGALIINQGSTLVAFGNTLTTQGTNITNIGTTQVAIGNSMSVLALGSAVAALGTTQTALGATLVAYGNSLSVLSIGATLAAIGGTLTAIGTAQTNMGSTLVAYGDTLLAIGVTSGAANAFIGTTASDHGGVSLLPTNLMGYVKRIHENLEGNASYAKSTGVWSINTKGGTLLATKTLTNTSTTASKA
jgi:hypothetical protein